MGRILIRNLDERILDCLRRRAAAHGASLEEEARQALASSVGLEREIALARLDQVRREIGILPGPTMVEELRRDRQRDEI